MHSTVLVKCSMTLKWKPWAFTIIFIFLYNITGFFFLVRHYKTRHEYRLLLTIKKKKQNISLFKYSSHHLTKEKKNYFILFIDILKQTLRKPLKNSNNEQSSESYRFQLNITSSEKPSLTICSHKNEDNSTTRTSLQVIFLPKQEVCHLVEVLVSQKSLTFVQNILLFIIIRLLNLDIFIVNW